MALLQDFIIFLGTTSRSESLDYGKQYSLINWPCGRTKHYAFLTHRTKMLLYYEPTLWETKNYKVINVRRTTGFTAFLRSQTGGFGNVSQFWLSNTAKCEITCTTKSCGQLMYHSSNGVHAWQTNTCIYLAIACFEHTPITMFVIVYIWSLSSPFPQQIY